MALKVLDLSHLCQMLFDEAGKFSFADKRRKNTFLGGDWLFFLALVYLHIKICMFVRLNLFICVLLICHLLLKLRIFFFDNSRYECYWKLLKNSLLPSQEFT